jgi:hypothetical protein
MRMPSLGSSSADAFVDSSFCLEENCWGALLGWVRRGVVRMLGARHCCTGSSGVELLWGQPWGGKLGRRGEGMRVRAASANGQGAGESSRERAAAVSSGRGARERRLQKVAEERKRKQNEEDGKYPEWAT